MGRMGSGNHGRQHREQSHPMTQSSPESPRETPLDKARLWLTGKTSSPWCPCSPCVVSRALVDIDRVTSARGERSPWRKVSATRDILHTPGTTEGQGT